MATTPWTDQGHDEAAGGASASPEGDRAARNSNLAWGVDGPRGAIDAWARAPFHARAFLNPQLSRVGFHFRAPGVAALDVNQGIDWNLPARDYVWPSGRLVDLLTFGGETPDPTAGCPDSPQYGLPVVVEFGARASGLGPLAVRDAQLDEDGEAMPFCLVGHAQAPAYLGPTAFVVIPLRPLLPGAHYSGLLATQAGTARIDFATLGPGGRDAALPPAGVDVDITPTSGTASGSETDDWYVVADPRDVGMTGLVTYRPGATWSVQVEGGHLELTGTRLAEGARALVLIDGVSAAQLDSGLPTGAGARHHELLARVTLPPGLHTVTVLATPVPGHDTLFLDAFRVTP